MEGAACRLARGRGQRLVRCLHSSLRANLHAGFRSAPPPHPTYPSPPPHSFPQVSKAQEREALLGAKYMVPLGRESRAVQTVFSDLHHHHMVAPLQGQLLLAAPGSLSGEAQAEAEAAAAAARGRGRSRAASPRPTASAAPSRPLSAATTAASQRARSGSGSPSRGPASRHRTRSRHVTSGAGLSEPGEATSAAEETEGGDWEDMRVTGSGESEAGGVGGAAVRALETAFAGAAASAAAAAAASASTPTSSPAQPSLPLHMLPSASAGHGAPSPDSPASLPPLTALNSPAGTLASSGLSPRLPSAAGGSSTAVSFSPTAAGSHRQPHPQPQPQPHNQRPASAMVAPLSGLSEARRAANVPSRSNPNSPRGTGGLAVGGPGGPSRLGGANSVPGAAAGQLSRLPQAQAQSQRRRHPDQVSRGSSGGGAGAAEGSWAALPTVKSTVSYGDDEEEGEGERSGSDVYGDSNAGGDEGEDEGGYEDEDEGDEYDLPPAAARTPSASATAAAAAAFASRTSPAVGDAGQEGVWQPQLVPQRSAANHSAGAGPDSPLSPLRQNLQQHQQRPYTAAPGGSGSVHNHPPSPAPARATASMGGTVAFALPAGSPLPQHHRSAGGGGGPTSPAPTTTTTASGIPHGWQQRAWDWVPEAAALAARGGPGGGPLQPYSRQALLEVLADIHFTKAHADQVSAAAAFPQVGHLGSWNGAQRELLLQPAGAPLPRVPVLMSRLRAAALSPSLKLPRLSRAPS